MLKIIAGAPKAGNNRWKTDRAHLGGALQFVQARALAKAVFYKNFPPFVTPAPAITPANPSTTTNTNANANTNTNDDSFISPSNNLPNPSLNVPIVSLDE